MCVCLEILHAHLFYFCSVSERNDQTESHKKKKKQPGFCSDAESLSSVLLGLNTQMYGSSDLGANIICHLDYIWECEPA